MYAIHRSYRLYWTWSQNRCSQVFCARAVGAGALVRVESGEYRVACARIAHTTLFIFSLAVPETCSYGNDFCKGKTYKWLEQTERSR